MVMLLAPACGANTRAGDKVPSAIPTPPPSNPNQASMPTTTPAGPMHVYFAEIPAGPGAYVNMEINDDATWCQGGDGNSPGVPTYEIDITLYQTDAAQNYLPPGAGTFTVSPAAVLPPATPMAGVQVAFVQAYQDNGPAQTVAAGQIVISGLAYDTPTNGSLTGSFALQLPASFAGPSSGMLTASSPCSRLGSPAQ